MSDATEERSMVLAQAADFAKKIEHSQWSNRIIYLWAVTLVLGLILGGAIYLDKPLAVIHTLAGLIAFAQFLFVVTPSAEQVSKMLAQVAAIRAGTRTD